MSKKKKNHADTITALGAIFLYAGGVSPWCNRSLCEPRDCEYCKDFRRWETLPWTACRKENNPWTRTENE